MRIGKKISWIFFFDDNNLFCDSDFSCLFFLEAPVFLLVLLIFNMPSMFVVKSRVFVLRNTGGVFGLEF